MYFPLSQIVTNLHTNGGEFVLKSTLTSYSGYYWKTSTEKYYTGKTPQDTPVEEIIKYNDESPTFTNGTTTDSVTGIRSYYNQYDNSANEYLNLKKSPPVPSIPFYSPTLPTQQDYQLGEMRRYFCKKSNEILYLEISKDTYNKLVSKDSTIAFQYYIPFNLPWQITGTKEQVFTVNRNIVELTMKQQKLPMFDMYLKKDYTKYTA